MVFHFDKIAIENKFEQAQSVLLNRDNISIIKYENYNHESFDDNNQNLLSLISQKPIVYCIWTGPSVVQLKYKYIGHVGKKYSRQRLRNHLTKKHEKTGAQLKKIIRALSERTLLAFHL